MHRVIGFLLLSLHLAAAMALANGGESCETAALIPALPYWDTGNTFGAIDNYGDIGGPCMPAGPGADGDWVYRYTPLVEQSVWIDICGGLSNSNLFVFEGSCASADNIIACGEICGSGGMSINCIMLVAGVSYYIVVNGGSEPGMGGPYTLAMYSCDVQPCADLALNAPGTVSGNTTGQGRDCAPEGNGPDQVVQIIIPEAGEWSFSMCSGQTINWNPVIYLSASCCGAPIATNDDAYCHPSYQLSAIYRYPIAAPGLYWITISGTTTSQYGPWSLAVWRQCDIEPTGIPEPLETQDSTHALFDLNGGCDNSSIPNCPHGPNAWTTAACGETRSGKLFTYLFRRSSCGVGGSPARDRDWYRITLPESAVLDITLTTEAPDTNAEFAVLSDTCTLPVTLAFARQTTPCAPFTASTPCLAAQTYMIRVQPVRFSDIPSPGADYNMYVTCRPCFAQCEPPQEVRIRRLPPPASGVRLWWQADNYGIYKVWTTAAGNNDGDPDNGNDPQWTLIATVPAPAEPDTMTLGHITEDLYRNYAVTHDCAQPPPGENCVNAGVLGGPLPIVATGTTAGRVNNYSTAGLGGSAPACWTGYYEQGASCGGPDVTYQWVVPATGQYDFSLCGSAFDTGLLIYNYTCPTEPVNPANFICGNDDGCAQQYRSVIYNLSLTAGQHILIVVDGYQGASGEYVLEISQ